MKAIGITVFEILRKGRMKAGVMILLKRSTNAPGSGRAEAILAENCGEMAEQSDVFIDL
jgi:hypothetical protein